MECGCDSTFSPWPCRNGSSDYFLCEAKRLKHEADREVHRTSQAVKYLEAVLYFILTGNAMEHGRADLDNVYRMYKETLTLIKHISSKFQKLQNDAYGSIDNKLAVLSLRCQSLLYKKLYELHKNDVRENMRALSDFQKVRCLKQPLFVLRAALMFHVCPSRH